MRDLARTLTAAELSLLVVGTVIGSGILQPGRAFAGAAVVLAGAPAFWLWRRVSQREVQ